MTNIKATANTRRDVWPDAANASRQSPDLAYVWQRAPALAWAFGLPLPPARGQSTPGR